MRFQAPEYFLLLLVFLAVFGFWLWLRQKREKTIATSFSPENQIRLGLKSKNPVYSHLYRGSLVLFVFFIIIALARPQLGARKATETTEEHSVVFLVDLSRSMLTKDVSPSRIDLMKFEIKQALDDLRQVQVGLIAFAGSVDLVSPLTQDLTAIDAYIDSLSPDSMVTQGTEIKTALIESQGYFERTTDTENEEAFSKESKVIVLFTDGEDHQQQTIDEVSKMREQNYTVFTVGVGTESGGYVPEKYGYSGFIKDPSGQAVISKPNFNFLKEMAKVGGGSFFYLDPRSELGPKLNQAIKKLTAKASSSRDFVIENEIYQIFLVLGLLFLPLSFFFRRLG